MTHIGADRLHPAHAGSDRELRVLLISGLSVNRLNSFRLQLELLATHLSLRGCVCRIAGKKPSSDEPRQDAEFDFAPAGSDVPTPADSAAMAPAGPVTPPTPTADVAELTTEQLRSSFPDFEPDVSILLGYPDQFPFIDESRRDFRVFLWAQFSHPPQRLHERVTVVPLTDRTRSYILSAGITKVGPTIPHAVDPLFGPVDHHEIVDHQRFGSAERSFLIGTAGTNQIRKRFDLLLDTFRLVLFRCPEAELCIKTDRESSPSGFGLIREIARRGIARSVTVLATESMGNPMPTAAMGELYRTFDLYLHTAEWEGFGIPVLEAIASGIPVVTHGGQGPGEFRPSPIIVGSTSVADESGATLRLISPSSAAAAIGHVMAAKPTRHLHSVASGGADPLSRYRAPHVADAWLSVIRHE